jgi:hypothetical protein
VKDPRLGPVELADATLRIFEPLIGDVFVVAVTEPASIELVLESAAAAGSWQGGRQPFSLVFHGPRDPLLAQAIYRFEHEALGALEIFVVPLGQSAEHTTYEAVFT